MVQGHGLMYVWSVYAEQAPETTESLDSQLQAVSISCASREMIR